MNDRRYHTRRTFEDRYRALENAFKQRNYTVDSLRNENHQSDLSHSPYIPIQQSKFFSTGSQRSNVNLKDREIAKLKALIHQKDTELITLTMTHKTALLQVEDRMERERKIWSEHKELLLADERVKFEEEKTRLLKDLQYQLNIERERCDNLEKKFYDAQMQSSEAKFLLKENDRERINAIYNIKEQCRKEYQDEINRLRNQFQLEKNTEVARIQERVHELEATVNHLSTANADTTARLHKLHLNLETIERTCVRSINDLIKKLLMTMDSPSHVFSAIPNISSFVYDETAVIERTPTRNILKFLQNTVDDIRNYILEQRIQIETKTQLLQKMKDRTMDHSNRTYDDISELQSKSKSDSVDNLIQRLEDHIGIEVDRLSKQRTHAKFESNIGGEVNQDTLIRHLQNRMQDLRNDNMRLRDKQQAKSIFSSYNESNNQQSFSSIRSRN